MAKGIGAESAHEIDVLIAVYVHDQGAHAAVKVNWK
jgi:hypothetical protein